MSEDFSISFIIPVLNGERYMRGCLELIAAEMADSDEIIVVDNGSTDGTLDIARDFSGVKILEYPDITIAALRNRGAEAASGDLLAFIDADCLVCEGWRKAVVEVLSDPSVAATGSHFDKSPHPSWIEKAWIPPRRKDAFQTHYIPSGNLVIRKEVFTAIGGFAEQLVTDEDTEIGIRLNANGYRIIDAPGVRVIHLGNAKTLKEFTGKEKWHATSILKSISAHRLDKPLVMTFIFMLTCLLSLLAFPLSFFININPWLILSSIFLVPVITALYRAHDFRVYRYIFQLTILFFIFFVVRCIIIIKAVFGRGKRKT